MTESNSASLELSAVVHQAHALVERRRFDQARHTIARGLKQFPDNTELQYLGAFVDYAQDDYVAANRAVREVLKSDPQHYGARMLCARLHEKAKEFAQAEALWIGLLRDYPEDAGCYAAYAELMLRTLHLDKAERLAREGLRYSPDNHNCLYVASLIDLVRRGLRQADNANLQRLLHEHPEHTRSSLALVIALVDRGEHRSALRVAQELLRNQPDSERLVTLVRTLKRQSHWSMLPLYPMQRWGWGGAAALTIAGIAGLRFASTTLSPHLTAVLTFVWLGYVIYSWTWPAILRKLL